MSTFRILLIAAVLATVSTEASAQQVTQSGNSPRLYGSDGSNDEQALPKRNPALSDKKREEIRRKIEAIRIWRLTEVLDLDAETSAKLSSLLSSMDMKRKNVMKDYTQAMRELRVSVNNTKPDETKIKTALDTIEKKHHEMENIRDQELSGIKNILTVEQQGRFLLFQHEFNHEMRKMFAGGPAPMRGQGMKEQSKGRFSNPGSSPPQDK